MDPGRDHHALLLLVDLIWHPVGDAEILALVAGDGPAESVS